MGPEGIDSFSEQLGAIQWAVSHQAPQIPTHKLPYVLEHAESSGTHL
jgi:hypothetical protein